MSDLINEKEVKMIRYNAGSVNFHEYLMKGKEPQIIIPTELVSGYKVSMTLDEYPTGEKIEHVSVGNSKGRTDSADAEIIAKAILGDGYRVIGIMFNKNVEHFMKPLDEGAAKIVDTMVGKLKMFRDMGIQL